ncbi:hypothetical protein SUGI_1127890 [Cryptomeria japonica]|uniref:probable 2' cyclic ADP-D-ribose synthase BdTIR n=1 Tax=Cryptomeria japonica TaxID=3369 RepID=UPI00241476EF|nr:probable 2' cyclic ADP-D-ribose synthase BdTIR [Cryptomeria japonica]GLJ52951.1 hypothetical protein SUGI_1127890 [Cryptomeria japonica]
MASSSRPSGRPERKRDTAGYFQKIAPSASTSGASASKPVFDVFINHRGPDVKKTLASRIYNILRERKVTVFLDSEELEYGDFLPKKIEAVIRSATLHIAIFSKKYGESPWCLAELSCMLKSGAKIVPIFYYADRTDLRYVAQRKGIYADAFNRHKKKCRYSSKQIEEWEEALYKASFYSGQIIKSIKYVPQLLSL